MLGSWQISGARHPTNSAKEREVLQGPVKICVPYRQQQMRDREREAKEREAGSRRKTGLRQIGAWATEDQGQMKRDIGTEYSDSFLPGHF